ncbi:MAG: alpha/beta hydrolase [Anaerolinea sp.]|nr:alpha/beta hydrolase [Anaerolinea sp.]
MKKRTSARRILIIVAVFLVILLYIGFPTAMAVVSIAPDGGTPGNPPADFTSVTLTTADNLHLGAWYAEPENGAVIILVHGAGGGRESVTGFAEMLHRSGFGVLAVSLSGFGDSEGQINRRGWNGTRDIGAAVTFLQTRPEVRSIGGLGLSMGGEILLGAASTYPGLTAVAVDGATFRALNEYVMLPMNEPLYRNFTHRVLSFALGVFSGDSQPEPPILTSIQAAEGTYFLFIAAGNVDEEIAFNQFYQDAVGERGDLWIVPNAGHTGGFGSVPEEYERRVIEFFRAHLL